MSELLGHYSDVNGAMDIVSHEILWATNVRFLNDEHEFLHALHLIREITPTANKEVAKLSKEKFERYIERVELHLDTLDVAQSSSVYTISFSRQTDLLSQWRGYCSGNNGYCLIYDVDELYKKAKAQYPSAQIGECVYNDERKQKAVREILNTRWFEYHAALNEAEETQVIVNLTGDVIKLASFFKHSSFSEEEEIRIVIILPDGNEDEVRVRPGRHYPIPYLEVAAPKSTLKKVIVGPSPNKFLAQRGMFAFLESAFGFPYVVHNVGVENSNVPYRSF